jgi:hypothetical protein
MAEVFLVEVRAFQPGNTVQSNKDMLSDWAMSLLREARVPAPWVEDAWWGGSPPPAGVRRALSAAGVLERLPAAGVHRAPGLDGQSALHAAAQAVASGDVHLALAGAGGEDWTALALLASTHAVGRHNLAPRAQLLRRSALPPAGSVPELTQALSQLLKRTELPPEELCAAACFGIHALTLQSALGELGAPDVRVLAHQGLADSLLLLPHLLAALKPAAPRGMLLSAAPDGALLATVVQST